MDGGRHPPRTCRSWGGKRGRARRSSTRRIDCASRVSRSPDTGYHGTPQLVQSGLEGPSHVDADMLAVTQSVVDERNAVGDGEQIEVRRICRCRFPGECKKSASPMEMW